MVKASSNLIWDEKNLYILSKKSINVLVEGIKGIKSNFPWFEHKKSFIQQGLNEKTGMFLPVFSSLLALADDFTTIDWVKEYPYPTISLNEIKSLIQF
jgi:hypothetical protein